MKKYAGIIGIVLLILINCLLFKIVLDKKLDLVEVPIAKQQIEPRTQIKTNMIELIEVPRVLLNEDCILEKKEALNKASFCCYILLLNFYFVICLHLSLAK